jgi:hypothetical protein
LPGRGQFPVGGEFVPEFGADRDVVGMTFDADVFVRDVSGHESSLLAMALFLVSVREELQRHPRRYEAASRTVAQAEATANKWLRVIRWKDAHANRSALNCFLSLVMNFYSAMDGHRLCQKELLIFT